VASAEGLISHHNNLFLAALVLNLLLKSSSGAGFQDMDEHSTLQQFGSALRKANRADLLPERHLASHNLSSLSVK
jgi:hypothetical protein